MQVLELELKVFKEWQELKVIKVVQELPMERGAVAWTRVRVDTSTAPFLFKFFFLKINHATSRKLDRSYDPHRSRDSMSPVCGIFRLAKEIICSSTFA